uniref:CHHC U11-48K-type domain-containing protein n=1 Tax=Anolis carolinensis TaxID=28377 RepID=A0A803TZL1_ANOCA
MNRDDNYVQYVDALDPDKLLQCPYEKSHQISAWSFPYHFVKCHKYQLDIVKKLVMCSFNACHRVPREEFKVNVKRSSWQPHPCEEDWEKELKNPPPASAFIWDTTSCFVNKSGI